MTAEYFQVRNKTVQDRNMSAVDAIRFEMRDRVRLAALPARPGDSVKACIRRAAGRLSLPFVRVRKLWYGLPMRVDAVTADLIRARTAHLGELQKRMERLDQEFSAVRAGDTQLVLPLDGLAAEPRRVVADRQE